MEYALLDGEGARRIEQVEAAQDALDLAQGEPEGRDALAVVRLEPFAPIEQPFARDARELENLLLRHR